MSPETSESKFRLAKPPIVEVVLDIDCDMPPGFSLPNFEKTARDTFRAQYPKFQPEFIEQHRFEAKPDELSKHFATRTIQGFRFFHDDMKQLVQVRAQGFSFNRLAPYSVLEDYLAEIRRTWELFVAMTKPVQIRTVRLRYVNRIRLPFAKERVELPDYLRVDPRLPEGLDFASFLNQHSAIEAATGCQVGIVLASQPAEQAHLPIILDIWTASPAPPKLEDWNSILTQIQLLQALQNRLFKNILTPKCLNLFS